MDGATRPTVSKIKFLQLPAYYITYCLCFRYAIRSTI